MFISVDVVHSRASLSYQNVRLQTTPAHNQTFFVITRAAQR